MIRALLFDLDNTLIPEADGWHAAFAEAVSPLYHPSSTNNLRLREAVFEAAARLWSQSPLFPFCDALGLGSPSSLSTACPGVSAELTTIRSWLPQYRRQSWTEGLRRCGTDDEALAELLARRYQTAHLAYRHHPYSDAIPILQMLAGEYRMAVVTNGFADLQRQKLESSGLHPYFDAIVISSEAGTGKPDPDIVQTTLAELQVSADEAMLIGDSVRDVAAAQAAGVACIWLQRQFGHSPESPQSLPSLKDLPARLTHL